MPFVKPSTVHSSAAIDIDRALDVALPSAAVAVVEHVASSGDDVTVYPVIDDPPVFAGADHSTATEVSPAVAVTVCGAPEIGDP